ncbi:MAG: hypothetical protein ISR65_12800 [Bacteriovoracaceae bacterium]|nr:hypothetical protein [Bacteriovoracaceae bacterium]
MKKLFILSTSLIILSLTANARVYRLVPGTSKKIGTHKVYCDSAIDRNLSCKERCLRSSATHCDYRERCSVSNGCLVKVSCGRFFGDNCVFEYKEATCTSSNGKAHCKERCLKWFGNECIYKEKCYKKDRCLVKKTCVDFFGHDCRQETRLYSCM